MVINHYGWWNFKKKVNKNNQNIFNFWIFLNISFLTSFDIVFNCMLWLIALSSINKALFRDSWDKLGVHNVQHLCRRAGNNDVSKIKNNNKLRWLPYFSFSEFWVILWKVFSYLEIHGAGIVCQGRTICPSQTARQAKIVGIPEREKHLVQFSSLRKWSSDVQISS